MCSLCRVAVCDTCWDGFHSRMDFFSSDVAVTQGPDGAAMGAAQSGAGAAQSGAGAAQSGAEAAGAVPLNWDEEDEEEE